MANTASPPKSMNHTSAQAGILKPRNDQLTSAHSPDPVNTFSRRTPSPSQSRRQADNPLRAREHIETDADHRPGLQLINPLLEHLRSRNPKTTQSREQAKRLEWGASFRAPYCGSISPSEPALWRSSCPKIQIRETIDQAPDIFQNSGARRRKPKLSIMCRIRQ